MSTMFHYWCGLRRFWPALWLSSLLVACAPLTAAPVRHQQTVDGVTIALDAPAQARVNHSQDVVITLTDAQGAPIDNEMVYLDLVMPEHPMGLNQPIAEAAGNGRYRTTVVYIMTGDWTTDVVATVQGRDRRATFTMHVTE
jgi:hypothetical protein